MTSATLRRRLAIALSGLVAPAGLVACGDSDAASDGEKVLKVAIASLSECNDPQLDNYGFGSSIGRQIVDSLTERNQDDPTKIEPWLATEWEISDDARVYTFHLRDDVTFSDGEKLTAQVVKDNFETLATLTGTGSAFVQGIESIETPDDTTVVITFEQPNAAFLQATAQYQLGIVSPKTLEKSAEERCAEGVVGSGPFVTDSFELNKKWVLTKRDGYAWPSGAREATGEAAVDRVEFSFITETSVQTGVLTSGQVDIAPLAFQDAKTVEESGFQLLQAPNKVPAVSLEVNTSRGPLAEQDVRLALSHAINREEVVEKAHSGLTRPATGSLTAASPFHIDQPDLVSYDPELSEQLLDDAGWKPGPDGVREKDGKPLQVTVSYASNPDNTRFLEVIQSQVKEVGFDFQLRPLTTGEFDEALVSGDYDLHRWSGALIDGDVLRTLFSAHTLNKAQLPEDNDLEPLFDKELSLADPDARREVINEIQDLVVGRGYQIPVFDMVTTYGASEDVSGVKFDDSAIWLYEADVDR